MSINGLHVPLALLCVGLSFCSAAQNLESEKAQETALKLETTIRGNKEQPQVLTIVPWQLPVHQRINENKEWVLQVSKMPSIERNAFLSNMAVMKELNDAKHINNQDGNKGAKQDNTSTQPTTKNGQD
jgi:hypothetical protein